MLRKLTLTNFRRHEHLVVDFTAGLNVVRAANEAGKSTCLEAAAYALYGAKVLRTPLAEAVTWGKVERELKVELDYESDGKVFTFSRSKGGAEVTVDGKVLVTGQNEVSAFASQLLGADAATAAVLMLSSQGSLRGALDGGPKATASLIESLAQFDLFDRILEAASEQLALGSSALFEERLKGLRGQLEVLDLPEMPSVDKFESELKDFDRLITEADKALVSSTTEHNTAYAQWKAEGDKRARRDQIERDIGKYQVQAEETAKKREAELAVAFVANLDGEVARLRAQIEQEKTHAARLAAWRTFSAFKAPAHAPGIPIDQVKRELSSTNSAIAERRSALATLRGEVQTLEAKKVSASVCGFCGQDVSQFPEVAEKNAAIDAQIQGKVLEIAATEGALQKSKDDKVSLEALVAGQDRVAALVRQVSGYVEVDGSVTPNRVTWRGEPPPETVPDSAPALREAEAAVKAMHARDARVEAYDNVIREAEAKVGGLHTEIESLGLMPAPLFEELEQAYLNAVTGLRLAEECLAQLHTERDTLVADHSQRMAAWQRGAETQARLEREIAQTERDIEEVGFNNALVKKIRGARPTVATKMWNLVLASVSTLFSQMRGEKSVVSKENGGFLVNGQAIESLSGSTLDILGLAVRVALIETFLPGCPFLVLDEPAQGCDDVRTEALVGFIASCGFPQTILVTHEATSSAVADNLIEL